MRPLKLRLRVRGAALTEFALVIPLLVVMLMFSMYFTELIRAKLKLQEATRYAAWEMTSYSLNDFGGTNHALAYKNASDETMLELKERFQDLDSIDNGPLGNFMVGYSGFNVTMKNNDIKAFTDPLPQIGGGTGSFIDTVVGALSSAADPMYRRFGFNTKGMIQVEVTANLDNRILPRKYLDDNKGFFSVDPMGGSNLQNLKLKNRFTLIADGWNLPDGADATISDRRAGNHNGGSKSGLYTQVNRMTLFGVAEDLQSIPGLSQLIGVLGAVLPNPLGTFVVSHNYGLDASNDRKCSEDPGLDTRVRTAIAPTVLGAGRDGMNNVQEKPTLDHERRRCYDTAPFRDHRGIEASQYIMIFNARGPHFMGCQTPQADDPTAAGAPAHSDKDKNTKKVNCEVGAP